MRSSITFTVLLTAVLSTFTHAVPITPVTGLNRKLGLPGVRREIEGSSSGGANVGASIPSVAAVFTAVFTQIQPLTEQLIYVNVDNATVAAISPVVAQIKSQLTSAVPQLQALIGQDSSVILAPVEGIVSLTVTELATLIAGDLCLLFTAIGAVLKVVVGDVRTAVLPMLIDLGCDVTSILKIVVVLVAGIVSFLAPLLGSVISIIGSLNLDDLLSLLGVSV
ncbi:hypothetical protein DFH29DRAFT_808980 [Suillus ampliporus]|nr:hypothetical protein DFH29DRAFT_808980 [Suillus ampliporus]